MDTLPSTPCEESVRLLALVKGIDLTSKGVKNISKSLGNNFKRVQKISQRGMHFGIPLHVIFLLVPEYFV